jgi:hypothetical protein
LSSVRNSQKWSVPINILTSDMWTSLLDSTYEAFLGTQMNIVLDLSKASKEALREVMQDETIQFLESAQQLANHRARNDAHDRPCFMFYPVLGHADVALAARLLGGKSSNTRFESPLLAIFAFLPDTLDLETAQKLALAKLAPPSSASPWLPVIRGLARRAGVVKFTFNAAHAVWCRLVERLGFVLLRAAASYHPALVASAPWPDDNEPEAEFSQESPPDEQPAAAGRRSPREVETATGRKLLVRPEPALLVAQLNALPGRQVADERWDALLYGKDDDSSEGASELDDDTAGDAEGTAEGDSDYSVSEEY